MSNLTEYAENELKLAGLFDKDSDYDGALGKAVLELVKVFSKQGHSGASASMVLQLFNRVAKFKPLTPIGKSKDEWMEVGTNMWQNKRFYSVFSKDKGKTWYDIDAPKKKWYEFWK
jgi:hypothetical protein